MTFIDCGGLVVHHKKQARQHGWVVTRVSPSTSAAAPICSDVYRSLASAELRAKVSAVAITAAKKRLLIVSSINFIHIFFSKI